MENQSERRRTGQGFSSQSALLAFDFDVVPEVPPTGIPLLGICILISAIALLALWHFDGQANDTIWILSVTLLSLSALTFIYEHFKAKRQIAVLMNQFREPVAELHQIHKRTIDYLKGLDQRASKYFHCVTNTKVTNYFILRQLENKIGAFLQQLTPYFEQPGHNSYFRVYTALRGNLEYRDGLDLSKGKSYSTPVVNLGKVVEGYIFDLDSAMGELEAEIEHLYDQV